MILLTGLDFLSVGKEWPPKSELGRLKEYNRNKLLFEGKHDLIFSEQFNRVERVIGNFEDIISYPVVINFHKLISLKIADLLFGEVPIIKVSEDLDYDIGARLVKQRAFEAFFETAIDVSRYGTGIMYLYDDCKSSAEPQVRITNTQPQFWFPVVSMDNVKSIILHVIAWVHEENGEKRLIARIHERGFITERHFIIENGVISSEFYNSGRRPTRYKGFGVIPVNNVASSDSVYGMSDYSDLDGIVSEIEVRIAQIAKVLDKHSSPSMTGPASALKKDEHGNWVFVGGSYIPNDMLDLGAQGDIKYITWDAQMDANFKQIDMLMNLLYMLSETGAALLGGSESTGRADSGTALKMRMISPIAKTNRFKIRFDSAIKEIVSEMTGISDDLVNIKWQDGLPLD